MTEATLARFLIYSPVEIDFPRFAKCDIPISTHVCIRAAVCLLIVREMARGLEKLNSLPI